MYKLYFCNNYFINWISEGDVDKSFQILESFDFVLDTSKLNEGMNLLLKTIGQAPNFNLKLNQSSSSFEISEEDINYIKKITHQKIDHADV